MQNKTEAGFFRNKVPSNEGVTDNSIIENFDEKHKLLPTHWNQVYEEISRKL